jgi:hypothetical protein
MDADDLFAVWVRVEVDSVSRLHEVSVPEGDLKFGGV